MCPENGCDSESACFHAAFNEIDGNLVTDFALHLVGKALRDDNLAAWCSVGEFRHFAFYDAGIYETAIILLAYSFDSDALVFVVGDNHSCFLYEWLYLFNAFNLFQLFQQCFVGDE